LADQGSSSRFSDQEIAAQVDTIITAGSIRVTTDRTYATYRKKFHKFIVDHNLVINEFSLERFLLESFKCNNSGNVAAAAVHALKQHAKILSLTWLYDLLEQDRIKLLVAAMKNLSPRGSKREKDPVPLAMLREFIIRGNDFMDWEEYVLVSALLVLTMRCMACGNKVSMLGIDDVSFTENTMRVCFAVTKTQRSGRSLVIEETGSLSCPVKLMRRFLELRKHSPTLKNIKRLFRKVDTRIITRWLRKIALELKFEGCFSSHSLRIGGASQAVLAGFSREMIMLMGDWTSDAVDRYLKSGVQSGKNLSLQMGF
jgi:hypothetical protein